MKLRYAVMAAGLTMAAATLPALASEATFDRTLQVSGRVELTVSTGSGNIHITRGTGTQVVIHGRVKSNWHSDAEDRVREVAAHPPIEQTGNIIRIGGHHENLHNVSIDYDIQAPANTFLQANSGSGDVTDDGVGENAKLGTGSGNITANGLQGSFPSTPAPATFTPSGAGPARSAPKPAPATSISRAFTARCTPTRARATSTSTARPRATGSSKRAPATSTCGPAAPA